MLKRFAASAFRSSALLRMFSTESRPVKPPGQEIDWVNEDFQEMKAQDLRLQYDKSYLKIMDAWQVPLEKKKKRQERIRQIKAEFVC